MLCYRGEQFQLCFLTLRPNEQQMREGTYGTAVISPERASATNLPFLNRREASVLQYFGIERALTLHPSTERRAASVLQQDGGRRLPPEQWLKQLKTLFMMALKRAGLNDLPALVFTAPPYAPPDASQVHVAGYCAGHHFSGVLSAGGIRTSVGHGSVLPLVDPSHHDRADYLLPQDQKVLQQVYRDRPPEQTSGVVCVPLISRYYQYSSRELYSKNADFDAAGTDTEASESGWDGQGNSLRQLAQIVKVKKRAGRLG